MARPASDNTAQVWKFLRGKGLTPAQAAGVIGVMQQESGQGLNPAAVNPSSGATGIAQWLGGRKNAAVESKQLGPQLRHLWSELQGPERGALQALKGAHTIEDATRAWLMKFERPGANEMVLDRRIANARNVFNRLSGVGGDPNAAAGGRPADTGGDGGSTRTTTTVTPGVDNSQARAQLVQQFLGNKNADVLDFAVQARGLQDIPGTTETKTVRTPGSSGTGSSDAAAASGGLARMAASRADVLDRQRLPYKWGGGHGGKTAISDPVPVDCSGAVSKVLGIDPRVSGAFTKWGRPGDGGNKGVTIYANAHHVLMKINGHFFGTSRSNPGGGAGWIPQSQITSQYLKGFTARHSNR